MSMIELVASAKINLTLEILRRRDDGYHDILSVVQAVSLADRLELEKSDKLSFECDMDGWNWQKSLAGKAAEIFFDHTGTSGALIRVAKRIPISSGLGGESSLAAAVLAGLDRLYDTDLPPGELLKMAARIGSDVAFFLTGGTALLEDTGIRVTPLPALPHCWVVLLIPDGQGVEHKTSTMYSLLTEDNYSYGRVSEKLVAMLNRGCQVDELLLYNAFDPVADRVFTGLKSARQAFRQAGASGVHLSGAGPALFSLYPQKDDARQVFEKLKSGDYCPVMAETVESSGLVGPGWRG